MIWNLEQYSNNVALYDDEGQSVTYGQLVNETSKLAGLINERSLVFVLCQNSIGSIVGYVSCINNRIPVALINSRLDDELLNNLIKAYSPSYLWVPKSQQETFTNEAVIYECFEYVLLRTNCNRKYEINDSLALLLTTSGSTGSPKFVRQSYINILSNAESIVKYLELTSNERPITTLPMNYTYGLSIINSHLLVGATILVTNKSLLQKEFWSFFKEQKATSFGGVPYTYEILNKLRFFKMELPSLKYMTQAGGKISLDLHKKFAEYALATKKHFIVMYGQCEATARMGYLPSEKALEKCGSMGIAIPGGKFSLIDEYNKEIEQPNTIGELVYYGSNVTMGYAECGEDLSKDDEWNGILHTGDMAYYDEDGYYYMSGRKKRFLKIFGNRVNLDEIDRMVASEFNSIEFVSSGVDDHMYLFLTNEKYSNDVKLFLSKKTGLNQSAFKTIVIDKMPRNEYGKIQYKQLATYYE